MAKIRNLKTGREKVISDSIINNPVKRKWALGNEWDVIEETKPKVEKAKEPVKEEVQEPEQEPQEEANEESNNLESYSLTQLRKMYPEIKAVSKKEFIEQIK